MQALVGLARESQLEGEGGSFGDTTQRQRDQHDLRHGGSMILIWGLTQTFNIHIKALDKDGRQCYLVCS